MQKKQKKIKKKQTIFENIVVALYVNYKRNFENFMKFIKFSCYFESEKSEPWSEMSTLDWLVLYKNLFILHL